MATTKTADKKTATKKTAAPAAAQAAPLAEEVLIALLHRVLVRLGEPARVSEIARELDDDSVGIGLIRHTLEAHPRRFVAVDRRWDIAQRYLDKQRPVERTLEELVATYGAAMPADAIPGELAQVYGRVREHFDEVAPRMLRGPRFFPVASGLSFGLRSWLLSTEEYKEDDLLFYNYLSAASLAPFQKAAKGADWGAPIEAARQIVAAGGGQPVDNRIIQYFAFQALGENFDAAEIYDEIATSGTFLSLPDHRWLPDEVLTTLREQWRELSAQATDMAPEEAAVPERAAEVPAKPLEITADDQAELRRYFEDREEIVTTSELLTNVLEIRPGSRTFTDDMGVLTSYLRSKPDEFLWVGNERFRAPGTLPPYIGQLPESLTFPTLPRFETSDGEILDQMIADAGLEDGLQDEILDPVAQDVNDQEANDRTTWPAGVTAESLSLRLVLKSHHKEIGTFPLAQVPFGFFPTEPKIVELTLRDAQGNGYPIYIDYNVQLIYGLFDVYADIAAESGAIVILEKTNKPDEYRFVSDNETDPGVFVSAARMEELSDYRSEIEAAAPAATYDIVRTILDHYRKGTSFLTLLTEVNLVRRTPRRLLASVLSGYPAFHPRANRWTFDAKKETEGFDKNKTGFIVR